MKDWKLVNWFQILSNFENFGGATDIGIAVKLVGRALRRLRELFVCRCRHGASELYQNRFHGIVPLPVGQTIEFGGVDLSIARMDARKVDLRQELDGRRVVWVVSVADQSKAVNAVLVRAVRWTQDGSVPG